MSKKKNPTDENTQPDQVNLHDGSDADSGQVSAIEPQQKQESVELETVNNTSSGTAPDVQKDEAEPALDTNKAPSPDMVQQDDLDAGIQSVDTNEQPAGVDNDTAGESVVRPSAGRRFNRMLGIVAAVLVLSGGLLAYSLFTDQSSREAADAGLIEQVGRLVVVPPDEVPRVSTVVDPTQTDQPFLANAKKGDKVLLYLAASKAIVYRPSTDQIVNMGPLVQPEPRLFVRNGTNKPISDTFNAQIKSLSGYQYVSQDKANNRRYTKTIVVDVTGSRPDVAKNLAEVLDVSVGELPEGESRPDADVMIITGSDISAR